MTGADSSVSGTNVSYTLHHGNRLVVNSSVDRGLTPHNLTLGLSAVEQLGPGCHNLTLSASNRVSSHPVSSSVELCLLEPVQGLQAWVEWAEDGHCPDSTHLLIGVSLERGAPARLLFTLTARGDALAESRDMLNSSTQTFTFSRPLEGADWLEQHRHQILKSIIAALILVCCDKRVVSGQCAGHELHLCLRRRRGLEEHPACLPELLRPFAGGRGKHSM